MRKVKFLSRSVSKKLKHREPGWCSSVIDVIHLPGGSDLP